MHKTTTLYISDSLEGLQELSNQLDESNWIPKEEMINLLNLGGMLVEHLSETYSTCFFTDDEVAFVNNLANKINSSFAEIVSDQNLE